MTPLLFIDPGDPTGWAARDTSGTIHFGSVKLAPARAHKGAAINALAGYLSEWHSRFLPEEIAYEEQVIKAAFADSSRPLLYYEGAIVAHADRHNIPAWPVSIQTVKKAMGHGWMSKDEVARVVRLHGHEVTDSHQADAIAGLYHRIGVLAQQSLGITGGKVRRRCTR